MNAKHGLAVLSTAVLLVSACGEQPTAPGSRLSLSPDSIYLLSGDAYTPAVVTNPPGAVKVVFASSAPEIAQVDSAGTITAGHAGRAVVRAYLDAAPRVADSLIIKVADLSDCLDCGGFPTLSIAAITDTAGDMLDLRALRGTIVVQLYPDVPPGQTLLLQALVDSALVCSVPGPFPSQPQSCRIDTEATVSGVRRFAPGTHVIHGVLRKASGVAVATTTMAVIFAP